MMETKLKIHIAQLDYQYNYLKELISGFDTTFLKQQFRPGKWSIHENIAHLGRYHEIFESRVSTILQEGEATFKRYNSDEDEHFEAWRQKALKEILVNIEVKRNNIIKKLSSLEIEEFQKTGHHPKFGKLSLTDWMDFFILHESHHLYTIFRIIHSNKK